MSHARARSAWTAEARYSLDLYRRLIGVQIRSQLQYRVAFAMDLLAAGFGTGLWFTSLALVVRRFNGIAGWSLGEVTFLYSAVEVSYGIMDVVFAGFDPDVFVDMIRLGKLDQLLVRPVDITLQILGSLFAMKRWGRVVEGLTLFALALLWTHVRWTAAKILYLPFVLAGLIGFFGGLYIIGSTLMFWTVQRLEAFNVLYNGGAEMISYPMSIYPPYLRGAFTYVLPGLFLNYEPALYFLDKPDPLGFPVVARFLAPVFGLGTLAAALAFWRIGLRHYQSTGT